jgi:hypothetical protein
MAKSRILRLPTSPISLVARTVRPNMVRTGPLVLGILGHTRRALLPLLPRTNPEPRRLTFSIFVFNVGDFSDAGLILERRQSGEGIPS